MDFGSILDAIWGVVQQVIDWVTSIINDLVNALNSIFGAIWNFLSNLVNALVSVFQKIAAFAVHLWQDYIKPAIDGLVNLYKSLVAWLKGILGPVLRIIARIRAWFYQYVYPWIKLAQQILSVVRAFLAALRILGVKWAAKLDAELAKIQGYITTALQDIVGTLNQATTWLNFAIDPLGIIRTSLWRNSLFSGLPALSRAVNFGKDRYLTASEAQNTQDDISMAGGGAAILTRNADGSVTFSPACQRINANADAAWNGFGPPKV